MPAASGQFAWTLFGVDGEWMGVYGPFDHPADAWVNAEWQMVTYPDHTFRVDSLGKQVPNGVAAMRHGTNGEPAAPPVDMGPEDEQRWVSNWTPQTGRAMGYPPREE